MKKLCSTTSPLKGKGSRKCSGGPSCLTLSRRAWSVTTPATPSVPACMGQSAGMSGMNMCEWNTWELVLSCVLGDNLTCFFSLIVKTLVYRNDYSDWLKKKKKRSFLPKFIKMHTYQTHKNVTVKTLSFLNIIKGF